MIKKTLYFGNPAYLSLRNGQLVVKLPEVENNPALPEGMKRRSEVTVAVEDIGGGRAGQQADHADFGRHGGADRKQLCPHRVRQPEHARGADDAAEREYDAKRALPPPDRRFLAAAQTALAADGAGKIGNQAAVLAECRAGVAVDCMRLWAAKVRSGDADNLEGRAAAYYWRRLFSDVEGFTRDREGMPPNNLLNYGYAILRAVVARALVASGLLPTLGIHHHNRYNAYCLADDVMEPYRPYVDRLVFGLFREYGPEAELGRGLKARLLSVPVLEVRMEGKRSPLMVAAGQTAASLYKCFSGELRRVCYPEY